MAFYAHSPPQDSSDWHLLRDHLIATAEMAGRFAEPFDAHKAATLAGLLHDLGKYTEPFQMRLRGSNQSVDHSTAGARQVIDLIGTDNPADRLMAWLVAYCIAGHHAGLPDFHNADGGSLSERLEKKLPALDATWQQEIVPEIADLLPKLDLSGKAFTLAFLGRMIFSALVDADFKDTEAYYAKLDNYQPDRDWPSLKSLLPDLRQRFAAHMAAKPAATPLGDLRHRILRHVMEQASRQPRFFTLTVPTGGGKTLASLGFALEHAAQYDLRRIIYAIPFTSVIEQTAKVFRDAIGNAHVLEHHAALEEDQESASEARSKLRLAMEDWAAPVIVTTNVQFFESLFANRPSRCRKLHNIAGSVIILDEAQSLPRRLLRPAAMALKELVRNYGCSIVFCTATQPALDQDHFSDDPVGLPLAGGELAPEPLKLAEIMRRTHIVHVGPKENDELVVALDERPQGLMIVNTRRHALDLYQAAKAASLDGLYHLSTRQHARDRQDILAEIRERLEKKRPCRVIATALVEAGVDVDFPAVWRAEAGLDQVIQAAGRCNREGKRLWQESPVSVFVAAQDYAPPREVKALAEDLDRIRAQYADLHSPAALEAYFRQVYWRLGDQLDAEKILDQHAVQKYRPEIGYRSIAAKFQMIDDSQQPVIIPDHPEWQDLRRQIEQGYVSATRLARELQRHIVQLPRRWHASLLAQGTIQMLGPEQKTRFPVLQRPDLYSRECGLQWETADQLSVVSSII